MKEMIFSYSLICYWLPWPFARFAIMVFTTSAASETVRVSTSCTSPSLSVDPALICSSAGEIFFGRDVSVILLLWERYLEKMQGLRTS